MALAANSAGSVDPPDIRGHIGSVSREGKRCGSYQECRLLLGEGDDIDIVSVTGVEVGEDGRPVQTGLELWRFEDNTPTAFDEIVAD